MAIDSSSEVERLREELSSTHANIAFLGIAFSAAEACSRPQELAEVILTKLSEYLELPQDDGFLWLNSDHALGPALLAGVGSQEIIRQLTLALPALHEGAQITAIGDDQYLVVPMREPIEDRVFGLIAKPIPAGTSFTAATLATAGGLGGETVIHLRRLARESRLERDACRAVAAMKGKLDLAEPSSMVDGLEIVGAEFGPESRFTAFATVVIDKNGQPSACAGEPVGFTEREALGLAKDFADIQAADVPDAKTVVVPVKLGNQIAGLLIARDDIGVNEVDRDVLIGLATAIGSSANRRDTRLEVSRLRSDTARQLIAAQERERAKIAADIHDDVIQQLSATAMRLELVMTRINRGPVDIDEIATVVKEETSRLREAVADTRALLMDIRPQVLDDNGLVPALEELARRVPDVKVEVKSDVDGSIATDIATSIFRITQEALSNVRKHSQASKAQVALHEESGQVILEIQDNGVGYEASNTGPSESGSHFGLLGMRERVRMHGGHFSIKGTAGNGTALRVDLPKSGLRDG